MQLIIDMLFDTLLVVSVLVWLTFVLGPRLVTIQYRKVGGIHFTRIGRLNVAISLSREISASE